jgi:HSP20 family protein
MNKPDKSQVFEMILGTSNNGPSFASALPSQVEDTRDWQADHYEGQLAVDVLETEKEVVVVSTMAGSDTTNIEVYVHNDLLTIRGRRELPIDENKVISRFHEECFWGAFSRSIVLPVEVKADAARAEYKNGILTVRIPKQQTEAKIPVRIVEE